MSTLGPSDCTARLARNLNSSIVEVKTKRQIRDSLKRNFLSQKIFRPPKVIFCCVGCFFERGMFPDSQKGTFADENLLREKISFERISQILRFVLTSTIPSSALCFVFICTVWGEQNGIAAYSK